ncbi:DUF2069 domain-containing protein [Thalassotalea euphylliae]|uniref:DUF2069 domain-containing protein n=1 Tax=Thalassotalea euphylliae TaxID=1655234 RepID=A0A3E0UEW1_9GAMM|nr:DUF2069 domain-containing protein [Thalassotalea euphylliae]REL35416.1 DUF2069 domain-containing protein [Thalassotalea euphylliae]
MKSINTATYKKIALIGYFGLLAFMPLWLLVLEPSSLGPWLALVLFVVPLFFPAKGMFKGNPYTFAWSNFIVMWYFLHSLTSLWVSANKLYPLIELIFASLMFFGGTYYAKYRGQELGLSIRKKKGEE